MQNEKKTNVPCVVPDETPSVTAAAATHNSDSNIAGVEVAVRSTTDSGGDAGSYAKEALEGVARLCRRSDNYSPSFLSSTAMPCV